MEAKELNVRHLGGEAFSVLQDHTTNSVTWGELFKEKERRFFERELDSTQLSFCIRDTFQISVRTVWRPEAKDQYPGQITRRRGRCAVVLHDFKGRLTNSWTWAKLVRPLYKHGMSVVMVDFPGFGMSTMNMLSNVKVESWRTSDWHILCQILDDLRLPKAHLVACGESCAVLIRMLQHSPHQVAKEHIFHNPVLDYTELFGAGDVKGGMGSNWRQVVRERQQGIFEDLLKNTGARIWATYDEASLERTQDTVDGLTAMLRNTILQMSITITEVAKEDICEAHIGARVQKSFLFIGKGLQRCYAQFLERQAPKPPEFFSFVQEDASLFDEEQEEGEEDEPADGSLEATLLPLERPRARSLRRESVRRLSILGCGEMQVSHRLVRLTRRQAQSSPSLAIQPKGAPAAAAAAASDHLPASYVRSRLCRKDLEQGVLTNPVMARIEPAASGSISACQKVTAAALPANPNASRTRILATVPTRLQPVDLDKYWEAPKFEPGVTLQERESTEAALRDSMQTHLMESEQRTLGKPPTSKSQRTRTVEGLLRADWRLEYQKNCMAAVASMRQRNMAG